MVCESEYKGQDLIPRIVIVASLFIGLLGFATYLRSGAANSGQFVLRQPPKLIEQRPLDSPSLRPEIKAESAMPPATPSLPQTSIAGPVAKQAAKPAAAGETEYYCGAETRKGTPCTRRVKGNTRCYQHQGMPAMLTADKLRIG